MVTQDAETISPRRVRAQFGLSRVRMARLLDVSAKTIERWEKRDAFPSNRSARARFAKLQEFAGLGLVVYTPEGFSKFLVTPLGEFGGRNAFQLIEQGASDDVLAALSGDYEGLGF